MGKPRRKEVITPDLMENLRFRFEETAESMADIARSVRHSHTWLRALAGEQGWTRFKPPPLDITPAARRAEEAGRLAASSLSLPPRGGGEGRFALRRQGEPGFRAAAGIEKTAGADASSPPTTEPSPPLAAPTGGGEHPAAAPSVTETAEQDADLSNLSPEARRARLRGTAELLDAQLAILRGLQAQPQREHERKELNAAIADLMANMHWLERQLQELDREHNVKSAIGDDGFPEDVDEAREELARRIDALVDEWLHEADADGAAGVEGEAGA